MRADASTPRTVPSGIRAAIAAVVFAIAAADVENAFCAPQPEQRKRLFGHGGLEGGESGRIPRRSIPSWRESPLKGSYDLSGESGLGFYLKPWIAGDSPLSTIVEFAGVENQVTTGFQPLQSQPRVANLESQFFSMSDFAQSVKQQADIVRVIGEYITLKKSGAQNYSGLCPFHGEKTPSFSVHVTRQFYHCFGCGVSGDVFKFVQEIEKVGFPEAVKIVAQKCGIALPKREFNSPEEAAESRLRGRLLELHEQATVFFEEQLKSAEGARAREYLTTAG